MRKFINLENKSLVEIHGLKPGKTARVEADRHGSPKEKLWRRRLKDNDGIVIVKKTERKEEGKGGLRHGKPNK